MQEMLDAPLDPEFVENNPDVKKIATKNPKTQQWFLDKKKLKNYKYGSNFSKADVEVLKQAETEQDEYAKLSIDERKAKLQNDDFIALQDKKIKVLEKIVKNINEEVRDALKSRPAEPNVEKLGSLLRFLSKILSLILLSIFSLE